MKDIVCIIVFASCLHSIAPLTSESKVVRSALSLLLGLSVLAVMCATIGELTESIRDFPQYVADLFAPVQEEIRQTETDSEKWVLRYGVRNIERGVQQMIISRFALHSGTVYVEADTGMAGDGAVTVDGLRVYVSMDAPCDDWAVEQYVSDMLACPCRVIRKE